jgi:hypothetical protein
MELMHGRKLSLFNTLRSYTDDLRINLAEKKIIFRIGIECCRFSVPRSLVLNEIIQRRLQTIGRETFVALPDESPGTFRILIHCISSGTLPVLDVDSSTPEDRSGLEKQQVEIVEFLLLTTKYGWHKFHDIGIAIFMRNSGALGNGQPPAVMRAIYSYGGYRAVTRTSTEIPIRRFIADIHIHLLHGNIGLSEAGYWGLEYPQFMMDVLKRMGVKSPYDLARARFGPTCADPHWARACAYHLHGRRGTACWLEDRTCTEAIKQTLDVLQPDCRVHFQGPWNPIFPVSLHPQAPHLQL